MAQWLKALAALPVDFSSSSSIHTSSSQVSLALAQGDLTPLLASMGTAVMSTYPDIDTYKTLGY